MLRVGLTGNVASGKSTVADAWRRAGARVIDADALAREAVAPDSSGLAAVRRRFGADVFDGAGALDRAALRRIVFADPDARRDLEAIVHPEVARLRAREEDAARAAGETLVIHEIPLLYEAGLERDLDLVVVVHASDETRLDRLTTKRGLGEAEARSMMEAQMPAEGKLERADIVIRNDDTVGALERRALEVLAELRVRAALEP
ncbi:MAG TPA: dephospho-CoA kinase [Longimicrobiales bacterium]|nr:dephospho-CoA kinase [Longimicrobiales bacterium]